MYVCMCACVCARAHTFTQQRELNLKPSEETQVKSLGPEVAMEAGRQVWAPGRGYSPGRCNQDSAAGSQARGHMFSCLVGRTLPLFFSASSGQTLE